MGDEGAEGAGVASDAPLPCPRSSACAAICSPVVAAAKPMPDATPTAAGLDRRLEARPGDRMPVGRHDSVLRGAPAAHSAGSTATTAPPVATAGSRVVSRPGSSPSGGAGPRPRPPAAPPASAAKAVIRPAVAATAAGIESCASRLAARQTPRPPDDAGAGDDEVRSGSGALTGDGAGRLQRRPRGGRQLVVGRGDDPGRDACCMGLRGSSPRANVPETDHEAPAMPAWTGASVAHRVSQSARVRNAIRRFCPIGVHREPEISHPLTQIALICYVRRVLRRSGSARPRRTAKRS